MAYPSKVVHFLTFLTDFAPGRALPPVVWGSSTSLALYIGGVNCTAAFIAGGTISGASAVPRAGAISGGCAVSCICGMVWTPARWLP